MERNDELEEMRSQIAILKEKLSNEEIVNDRLFSTVVKSNKKIIGGYNMVEYICCAFVVIWSILFLPHLGVSSIFIAGTILLMIFCAAATAKINWKVSTTDFTAGNMLEAAKDFKKLKNSYRTWLAIGIPLGLAWAAWFFIEILNNLTDRRLAMGMVIGGCIGAVVGGLIGFYMNRRVMKACDEVIAQIEN